ncbi:RNA polymerase sigma-70 factor [Arachidicoccus ginsenosidivorans]|uniref:Sigma-70 family RNA polymerase sigma factor n=1 Tax=Arachidicoccus ginsenosidivorans TaxID=496057 RepID=A0A5B8VJM9_9BACT|nr:sigma-70 family RNA polymerase sigma factor [Arachidicoccus ginsenosidivorans]QEC70508.1 sigma-70 family RNA polymerase sigma factor [Arachidicoccus ginsenosidivorans]
MKQQTVPEIELWYAASNGDAMAFGRLFELYFPKLFIFALKYTKDRCQAEDAIQQVFLKCWEKKETLKHINNIASYLHRSVKNELIDLIRRQVLYKKYQQQLCEVQQGVEPSVLQNTELSLRVGREAILSAAINHLSPQQRRVYTLSKERGWSYAKIAQEMEVSMPTVKWHAAAAFQALSRFLKNHESELFLFIFFFSLFF